MTRLGTAFSRRGEKRVDIGFGQRGVGLQNLHRIAVGPCVAFTGHQPIPVSPLCLYGPPVDPPIHLLVLLSQKGSSSKKRTINFSNNVPRSTLVGARRTPRSRR